MASDEYKIVLFGSLSVFSYAVMLNLLKRNIKFNHIVISGAQPVEHADEFADIPVYNPTSNQETIESLAVKQHTPIIYTHNVNTREFQYKIDEIKPDFILIACFPYRLPTAIWQSANIEALNLHPSLLPAYRGPYPVFWQLYNGEFHTGITLHRVSDELDCGDIILQTEVKLRPGMRGRAIDMLLGEYGAILFNESLRLFERNNITAKIQNNAQASYMPTPTYDDFCIPTQWSALRAFSFMRATEEWKHAFRIPVGTNKITIKSVMAYSPSGMISKPYVLDDNYATIQFNPGLINAYIKDIT